MSVNLNKCLKKLIKPVASFCVRHGLSIQDLLEAAKLAIIEAATEEIERQGKKPNSSRLSAMTGIRRPEIKRVVQGQEYSPIPSLVSRVVAQWEQDARFSTKAGKPRLLNYEEDFHQLVLAVSSDLHPGTVMFELERLNLIDKKSRGLLLKDRRHVVTEDVDTGFTILSDDISELTLAAEENLLLTAEIKNLHGKTIYDNIYHEDLPQIKTWLLTEGTKFHHRVRNFIAEFDKDINPNPCKTAGASVTFCTFSRVKEEKK